MWFVLRDKYDCEICMKTKWPPSHLLFVCVLPIKLHIWPLLITDIWMAFSSNLSIFESLNLIDTVLCHLKSNLVGYIFACAWGKARYISIAEKKMLHRAKSCFDDLVFSVKWLYFFFSLRKKVHWQAWSLINNVKLTLWDWFCFLGNISGFHSLCCLNKMQFLLINDFKQLKVIALF